MIWTQTTNAQKHSEDESDPKFDEESQQQEQKDGNRSETENENRNMILTIPTTTTIRKDKSMIAVDATNEIEMLVKAVSTTSLILTTAYPFKTKFNSFIYYNYSNCFFYGF